MGNPATPGKPLPVHPSYSADVTARAFWCESFRTSRRYLQSVDAYGQSMLVRHERETPEGFSRRQRITKPRNFVGPIIRRYNDFVWRLPATRQGTESMVDFLADVDGKGTAAETFWKETLLNAQVERESYILLDAEGVAETPRVVSQAQAQTEGARPTLSRIGADAVVWWEDCGGALSECIIVETSTRARYYDETSTTEITVKGTEDGGRIVVAVGQPIPHGYPGIPVVRMRPAFDPLPRGPGESQAAPIAEAQQGISQLLSLLLEEIHNVTFTQWVAIGISPDELKDLTAGNNRIVCIPNPQGKLQSLGADPAQAKTIMSQILDETENLFRVAGVNFDAQAGAPESGIAKAFRFNDLAANLAALADAVEAAENQTYRLLAGAWEWSETPSAKYPDDFNMPDFAGELESLSKSLIATEIPAVIRRKLTERFTARNLPLAPEEIKELAAEMAGWSKPRDDAGGAMPGPSRFSFTKPPAGKPADNEDPEKPGDEED